MLWQIVVVALALVAIAVLLISQQPALLPVVQEVKPASGGVYTEGLIGTFGRLNPLLDFGSSADQDVDRLIYSSLIRFDDRGLPVYDLVESMGISRDGTIYNFSLRDAQWHDGEPLTSADIVFTTDLLRSEDLPVPEDIRSLWQSIEIEALDEKTLQFRLPEPFAPFLDYLTFGILPQHLLKNLTAEQIIDAQFNLKPTGSGPYRFDHLLVEDGQITGVVLASFEKYYHEPAFIKQFVFRYYPDAGSILSAYQQGEVLGISRVTNDILLQVLSEDSLKLHSGQVPALMIALLNLDNPEVAFFQDASIRRAMLMGINRPRIIHQYFQGQATIANGPIFPNSWAYYDGIEQLTYDPETAINLLKQAGYNIPPEGGSVRANADGVSLEFDLLYPNDPRYGFVAEALVNDWSRLGIRTNLVPVEYPDLVSDYLEPRTYQAALVELNLSWSPDPDPYPFWHQAQVTGGQNYSKWDDRQASEYLEQARIELDITERTRLYRNFQVRFASELPALPLFYPIYNYAIDKTVQGVTIGPLYRPNDRFATVNRWFLIAERALVADTVVVPTP